MYIDDGVADLQHVNSRIQVSKYTQLGCFADPEPSTGAVEHHGFPQEEPLEARGVHHGDAVDCGQADLHAPEVLADEAEARHVLSGSHYAQVLQDGAPGEEVLHVAALHLHGAEDELAAELDVVLVRMEGQNGHFTRSDPTCQNLKSVNF